MMRSLFSAVSGLKSNQTAMDVIGNNIANVNTIAYKTSSTVFQDIFSQTVATATAPTADTGGRNAKQVGLGAAVASIGMNMNEGSTQTTSRPLDFAISGEGLFIVDNGDNTYSYTRNGNLDVDSEGYLVMKGTGKYVMAVVADSAGAEGATVNGIPDILEAVITEANLSKIKISGSALAADDTDLTTPLTVFQVEDPATGTDEDGEFSSYAIDANGFVTAIDQFGTTQILGRLALATFNNASGLEKVGSSLYNESSNSGEPNIGLVGDNRGTLDSGSLEMSNVDLSTELTNMIITQRGFQANSRVITTTDSMLEELINLKR